MRQTVSGVVAAIALMTAGAAPAMACGFTACSPCGQTYSPCQQVYTPPVVNTGCNTGCGGWAYERLANPATQYYAEPAHQYYYVNQGPTFTGPGAFAPYPTYQEEALSGAYRHHSYRWHHSFHYRPWHHSYRYGYVPHHYGYMPYYYGHRVLRRYY